MNQFTPIHAAADVQLWRQGSGPVPGWLMPWMIGRVEANGTFLIETPLGQPSVRALAFVLSMYLDADASIASNKAIRERGDEVGKVVAGQVRWLRENRETANEPVLLAMMREMAGRAPAVTIN